MPCELFYAGYLITQPWAILLLNVERRKWFTSSFSFIYFYL